MRVKNLVIDLVDGSQWRAAEGVQYELNLMASFAQVNPVDKAIKERPFAVPAHNVKGMSWEWAY